MESKQRRGTGELKIFWPTRCFDDCVGYILGWQNFERGVVVVATVLQCQTVIAVVDTRCLPRFYTAASCNH